MELLLFANIAIVLTVAATLYFTFPKRLSELIAGNRYRLDGSVSQRRVSIEARSLRNWFNNVVFFGLLSLVLVDIAFMAANTWMMSLDSVWEILECFSFNLDTWKDNVRDRSENSLQDLRPRQIPVYFLIYGFGFLVIVSFAFALCRWYIRSLVQLANRVQQRKQNYLIKDMETRIDAVEDALTADQGTR